ncbi:hypothetical protein J4422_02260 [Candidatus Pacearchaeota archaeon]|nr:hypothetical protein [Candidatus Pacearchaeota archaeon]
MPWRILVYESGGQYYALPCVSLNLYEMVKEDILNKQARFKDMKLILSKSDLPDEKYDDIGEKVFKLLKEKNDGKPIDLEGELECVFREV